MNNAHIVALEAARFAELMDWGEALCPDGYDWSVSLTTGLSIELSVCEATRLQAVAWEHTLQDRLWEAECAIDDLVCEVIRLRKELQTESQKMHSRTRES